MTAGHLDARLWGDYAPRREQCFAFVPTARDTFGARADPMTAPKSDDESLKAEFGKALVEVGNLWAAFGYLDPVAKRLLYHDASLKTWELAAWLAAVSILAAALVIYGWNLKQPKKQALDA